MTILEAVHALLAGRHLSEGESHAVVTAMLQGEATPVQVTALLIALRLRNETVDEVVGAARAMRAAAVPVVGVPGHAVDTCGTGGDGSRTLNVSTAAAIVVAGAGVPVAKHGNRAVSGTIGSADVLEALGVRLVTDPRILARCVHEVGLAFLFAPSLHPAMRHVAGTRRELGVRTLFNMLGPLTNPAGVRRQVIGVAESRWVPVLAHALARLGTDHAWVVHGDGGLDELSLEGESMAAEVIGDRVTELRIRATAHGLMAAPIQAIQVASVEESARRIRAVLAGELGPARDAVRLNAAAALVVSGRAPDLDGGVQLATEAIDSGAAATRLERLVAFTTAAA